MSAHGKHADERGRMPQQDGATAPALASRQRDGLAPQALGSGMGQAPAVSHVVTQSARGERRHLRRDTSGRMGLSVNLEKPAIPRAWRKRKRYGQPLSVRWGASSKPLCPPSNTRRIGSSPVVDPKRFLTTCSLLSRSEPSGSWSMTMAERA